MQCSEQSPFSRFSGNFSRVFHNLLLRNLTQNLFSEKGGNGLHFASDKAVFIGKVAVVALGVNNTKAVTCFFKIKAHALNNRTRRIGKVDCDKAADRASHLVKQTAGLFEMHIFGVLGNFCNFNGTDFSVIVKMIENCSDKNFKRRRGRKTGAGQNL